MENSVSFMTTIWGRTWLLHRDNAPVHKGAKVREEKIFWSCRTGLHRAPTPSNTSTSLMLPMLQLCSTIWWIASEEWSKEGADFILMPVVLKWDVEQSYMDVMVECTNSSVVITAPHSPTKIWQTQNSKAKNNRINILLLLKQSLFAVSKCTSLCQKKLGLPFHRGSHSKVFQPHLSLSKVLTTKYSFLSPPLTSSLSTALS